MKICIGGTFIISLHIMSRFSSTFNFISIHSVHSLQFSEFRIKANYFKTAHLECAKHDIVLLYLAFKPQIFHALTFPHSPFQGVSTIPQRTLLFNYRCHVLYCAGSDISFGVGKRISAEQYILISIIFPWERGRFLGN